MMMKQDLSTSRRKQNRTIKEGERWTPQAPINKDSTLLSPGNSNKTNESNYLTDDIAVALTAGQTRGAQGDLHRRIAKWASMNLTKLRRRRLETLSWLRS
jgi:hypothetical protein